MKKCNRTLSWILCLIMVFSLTACGGETKETESPADNKTDANVEKQTEAGKETEAPAFVDGPLVKYETPITITTAYQVETSVTIPGGMTASDNMWIDAYRDILGIEVVNEYEVAGWDAYCQQINLMATSGEMPDIFWTTAEKLPELVEAGLVADLTDVYEEYATDLLKEEHGIDPAVLGGATIDGRLYGIPQVNLMNVQLIWTREDWREALGADEPETFDELIDLLYAFTNDDPDGNGVDDTYGLSGSLNYERYAFIYNAYHSYPGIWYYDDAGELVYGSVQPEVKDALAMLRQLYADGVIHPDALNNDYGASCGDFSNGVAGVLNVPQYGITGFRAIFETNPSVKLKTYGNFSVNDQPALHVTNNPLARVWCVSATCENPEAAVKMANLNIGTLYEAGFAGTDPQLCNGYTLEGGGMQNLNFLETVQIESMLNHVKLADSMRGWGDGTYDLAYMESHRLDQAAIDLRMGGDAVQSMMWNPEYGSITTTYLDIYEAGAIKVDVRNKPTETMTKYWSTLNDKEYETFIGIIMGELELDAFDDFVDWWYESNGQVIVDEMRELYK